MENGEPQFKPRAHGTVVKSFAAGTRAIMMVASKSERWMGLADSLLHTSTLYLR